MQSRSRCRVAADADAADAGRGRRACEPTTTAPKGRLAAASVTSTPRHAPETVTSGRAAPEARTVTTSRNARSRASGLRPGTQRRYQRRAAGCMAKRARHALEAGQGGCAAVALLV
jgi:hypothetical protein